MSAVKADDETPSELAPALPISVPAIAGEVKSTAMVVSARELEESGGSTNTLAAYASEANFRAAQRMAMSLAASTMVPKDYQGSPANCLVALELAARTRSSVFAVMQNMHVIQGRPSWSSKFLIASINSSGRFTTLRYETRGGADASEKKFAMRAYATDKETGDRLDGEWITWAIVDGEGWSKKPGSKWLTIPGQMFHYRAASFWCSVYAPEISLGMHSEDETDDFTPLAPSLPTGGVKDLNEKLAAARAPIQAAATVSGG